MSDEPRDDAEENEAKPTITIAEWPQLDGDQRSDAKPTITIAERPQSDRS